ncbi:DUF6879 family protein [Actinoplanes sp. N902-109]|uniref:DUF6879 family protein n=1 Tax=Actinoplanes sp. (strain N902-109) TaxID=649831 RepID=UPI001E655B30|nr:DUF6879 family protein [Actinoplanes sp. N902-109]
MTRKALTTVGTGGLTFLVTDALNQPQATSITLSILIGAIALMLRFQVDFERRLAAVEQLEIQGMTELKKLIEETFGDISDATELHRTIDASPLGTGLVRRLARNAAQIPGHAPPIVAHFVRSKIEETADLLKQIAENGTVTYYGEDREWLLGLTRNAAVGIDAISMAAVDHALWQSEIGQRYLDAQRRVAAEGKRVRRIFVLDVNGNDQDPDLLRVCAEQRRMDIEVRLLARTDVPPPLRVQVRDLILFDDTLAYETTPTTTPDPKLAQIAETRLVLTDRRVKECAQLFRELWDAAHEPQMNT